MKYAAVLNDTVIIITDSAEKPVFPPTLDGKEVMAIEIYPDEKVCIGMKYTEEDGFQGECLQEKLMAQKELPQQPQVEYISREDFDLLDITYSDTMYYITEENGMITMKRGEE